MRAIVERDFLAEFASERAFRSRSYLALLVAVAIGLTLVILRRSDAHLQTDRIASYVFAWSAGALLASIVLLAPASVVGAVLAERLQSTLVLLLASPVGPYRIAFAKLLARAGAVFGFAAAALPPLLVPLLYGGVSGRQVIDLGLVAAGLVLEMSAWGLVVSAWSTRLATASLLAYLLPIARWTVCAAAVAAAATREPWGAGLRAGDDAGRLARTTPIPGAVVALAPDSWAASVVRGTRPGLPGGPGTLAPVGTAGAGPAATYLLWSLAGAAAAVVIAGRRLSREAEPRGRGGAAPPRPAPPPRRRERSRLQRAAAPAASGAGAAADAPAIAAGRRPGPGSNPVAWRERTLLNTGASRPLYYGAMAALALVFLDHLRAVIEGIGAGSMAAPLWRLHEHLAASALLLSLVGATAGAAAVGHERTQGTWDLLRASPLAPVEIMAGKREGLLRGVGFLGLLPAAVLLTATLWGDLPAGKALLLAVLTALPPLLFAHVGLYLGTRLRRPALATTASVVALVLVSMLAVGVGNVAHAGWSWTTLPGNPNLAVRCASPYYLVAAGTCTATEAAVPLSWAWWTRGGGEPWLWVTLWGAAYAAGAWCLAGASVSRLARELEAERAG